MDEVGRGGECVGWEEAEWVEVGRQEAISDRPASRQAAGDVVMAYGRPRLFSSSEIDQAKRTGPGEARSSRGSKRTTADWQAGQGSEEEFKATCSAPPYRSFLVRS